MKARATTMPRMPIGTFTKKIQFQLMSCVITPPTIGPNASASAEVPAQMPIAVPRWRGGKAAIRIDSVAGFIMAAPTPCAVRAAISDSARWPGRTTATRR